MKKILLTSVIILISSNVFGELPRTKTIGTDTLSVIRNACKDPSMGGDELIHNYYMEYKGTSLRDEGEAEEIFDERGRGEVFHTSLYMKYAFGGVIDIQLQGDPNDYLLYAYRHLFDPTYVVNGENRYLSIANEVIPYLTKPVVNPNEDASPYRKGLDIGYMLEALALTVDMLWWYEGGIHQSDLAAKLDSLAWYTYDTVLPSYINWCCYTTDPDSIIPTTGWTNVKLRLLAALGYAGCVLKDVPNYADNAEDYYNEAKEQLFESLDPTTENTFDDDQDGIMSGYMDVCFGDGSGLYKEGFSYYSWSMEFLTTFFTAAKRSGWGDNFYIAKTDSLGQVYSIDETTNHNNNISINILPNPVLDNCKIILNNCKVSLKDPNIIIGRFK